ncbi:ATP-binding protein [Chungangia koreensis]|uniref:ATP-binding protein n=1 Tax=Chungangia koreensis TaxID=752657 RepID=A0ABV8X029_9LACT
MKRLLIATVGKTHSGKTTFARSLEKELQNSVVIDQDVHAEFLLSHYPSLIPKRGPHRLKFAITRSVVDYAVSETNQHIILCNSNENRVNRLKLLEEFRDKGFTCVLVHFDMPQEVLLERIATSGRRTDIIRTVTSFEEVLQLQESLTENGHNIAPDESEADYVFTLESVDEMETIIREILKIVGEYK